MVGCHEKKVRKFSQYSTYTKAGTTFTISLFKTNSLTCGLFF